MITREMTYPEYLIALSSRRTPLSDHYAGQVWKGYGKIYALVSEKEIVSFLILVTQSHAIDIAYIETAENLRRRGYARQLLHSVLSVGQEKQYCLHLITTHPACEALRRLAAGIGFAESTGSTVFTGETGGKMWERMDALPLEQMGKMLLGKSGSCPSFRECTEAQLQAIRDSDSSEFGNSLSPGPFLDNPAKALDKSLSFAMFEGEKLMAYSLVTRLGGGHVIIEQISSEQGTRGAGYIVVPMQATLRAIRADKSIAKMSMTIYDDNAASRNFVFSILKGVELKETKNQYFYYYSGSGK